MFEFQENAKEVAVNPIKNIVCEGKNGLFTTSLIVAQAFEKEHKDVLKAISNKEAIRGLIRMVAYVEQGHEEDILDQLLVTMQVRRLEAIKKRAFADVFFTSSGERFSTSTGLNPSAAGARRRCKTASRPSREYWICGAISVPVMTDSPWTTFFAISAIFPISRPSQQKSAWTRPCWPCLPA